MPSHNKNNLGTGTNPAKPATKDTTVSPQATAFPNRSEVRPTQPRLRRPKKSPDDPPRQPKPKATPGKPEISPIPVPTALNPKKAKAMSTTISMKSKQTCRTKSKKFDLLQAGQAW